MDTKDIERLIQEKEDLFSKLEFEEKNLIDLKTEEKEYAMDLWLNTNWDEVIDGRATDKTKKAYVDAKLREVKEFVEKQEIEIKSIERLIEIIDYKLMFLGVRND